MTTFDFHIIIVVCIVYKVSWILSGLSFSFVNDVIMYIVDVDFSHWLSTISNFINYTVTFFMWAGRAEGGLNSL